MLAAAWRNNKESSPGVRPGLHHDRQGDPLPDWPEGPWQVMLPGVFLNRGGQLTAAQRATAAYLYAGQAIAITGAAALAWHGIRVNARDVIDVLVPPRNQRGDAAFAPAASDQRAATRVLCRRCGDLCAR